MVDTVLYFENDPASRFTMIRSVKNRFGAIPDGLQAIQDRTRLSELFDQAMTVNSPEELRLA